MTAARHEDPSGADGTDTHNVAAIGAHVLRVLGRPADAHRVVVRRLWAGSYRVNVLIGTDVTSTRIAHSYFLTAGDDGTGWDSIPPITRQYRPPAADEVQAWEAPS